MSSNNDISVVIPSFNRAHCISNAIESAINQTLAYKEIIVVDDGSTDDTYKTLLKYGDQIRVIRQKNQGVSVARNVGVHAATGEWIAFLDSDDEWEPEKLAIQMRAVQADSSAVVHVTNGWMFDTADSRPVDFFSTRQRTHSLEGCQRVTRPLEWALDAIAATPGIMVRRVALLRAGLFDSGMRMFEDFDLLCRLAAEGPWIVDSQPLFRVYRRGPAGQSLSEQCDLRPEYGKACLIEVYRKALQIASFSRAERLILRRKLAGVRAELAASKWESGVASAALSGFVRSVMDYPSGGGVLRAVAGLIAGHRGIAWAKLLRDGPQKKGFYR